MALRDVAIVNLEYAMRRPKIRPSTSSNNNNSSSNATATTVADADRPQASRQTANNPTAQNPTTPQPDETAPPQYGEDDIGVTLDYEPQNPDGIPQEVSSDAGSDNEESSGSRRRRRRNDEDSDDNESGRGRRRFTTFSCCRFYWHHWFGQFLSGIFTGLIFFVIGVVFIVYFQDLPTYIGVLFILVSLPPCCMSINRWRFARMQRRQQQRTLNRLNAVRRLRSRGNEDEAHRGTSLPFPDLPPSYNNLGFVTDDPGLHANPVDDDSPNSLSNDVIAPPNYDDAVKLKQMMEEQRLQEANVHTINEVVEVVNETETSNPSSTNPTAETEPETPTT